MTHSFRITLYMHPYYNQVHLSLQMTKFVQIKNLLETRQYNYIYILYLILLSLGKPHCQPQMIGINIDEAN